MVGMSDNLPMDVQTLIDKAGGEQQFRALFKVARTTVLGWKRSGLLPANRIAQISEALDVPLEAVIKLAPEPRQRANASAEDAA